MTLAEWQALTPDLEWPKYVAAAGAPTFATNQRCRSRYFRAVDALVASTSLSDLKAYLTWQLVNARAEMLPRAFEEANFDFYSRTLGGQQEHQPRWRQCVTQNR